MYVLLALLLSLLILFKSFRGARLVSTLNNQSLIDQAIRTTIVRLWSTGALAVVIVLAISQPNHLYQPLSGGTEYWQSLTAYLVVICTLILLAIAIFSKHLAKTLQMNSNSPITDTLRLHKPGRRRYGLLLALAAAVNEELLFRAAIPLVFFMATNNLGVAAVASICLFALGHIYQGVGGVVSSSLGGILLLSLFIGSGNILAPMLLHFIVDLLGLIILPSLKDNPYLRQRFG